MTTTVLADDHPTIRQGVRTILEGLDRCQVVGEASDDRTALELFLPWDRCLPFWTDLDGLEVARRVQAQMPDTRVIMLSMHADEPYVLDALRFGVNGYVLKESATTDLIEAVNAAIAGRRFLSGPLAERALDAYSMHTPESARPLDRYELLTSRERDVLQLAAQGLSNGDIGDRLAISPRTAETHRANQLRKLGIQPKTDLVRFSIGRGLISHSGSRRDTEQD